VTTEPNKTIVASSAVPQPITGEFAKIPSPTDLIGTVLLGRYRVLSHIGDGGMGSVYLVEHTTILKKLAIKVLSRALSSRADYIDRFLREARAASVINHPNVVEITDFGSTADGSPFFVMEFLQGEDLSHTVAREGAMPWARARPIMLQICAALQAAHEQGIVHRDMKPGNCLRIKHGSNGDYIKVLDFGIAKIQSSEAEEKALTQTGTVIGTPEYMSPEQGWGHPVDHRSDIYAVGVILYELLTGGVPFTGETMMEILNRHIYEVPDINHPNISPEIGAVILKAMQKDRGLRFQSMSEMIGAIEAVGTGAQPVQVVDEEIKAPWGLHTARYSTAVTRLTSAHRAPNEAAITETTPAVQPPRRGNGMIFGLVGVGVAAAVAIAFMLGGGGDPQPPAGPAPTTPPVAEATPDPKPEALPTPPPVVLDPAAEKVRLDVATPGVEAQILDARDEAIYGMTNSPDGIEVKKGDTLELILRAAGYEDQRFTVVADRAKRFEKTMVKAKGKTRPVRPGKGKDDGGGEKTGTEPSLGEIKDPFAGK